MPHENALVAKANNELKYGSNALGSAREGVVKKLNAFLPEIQALIAQQANRAKTKS